jgi:glycosyltransferase involved in cell wall biosynthesis
MDLSIVVPTLNARDDLSACLDAVAEFVPDAEVIVANGPSADGTTGMVRERGDVTVLVEIADRTVNAARNAGINRASGDVVALVNPSRVITADWPDAVEAGVREADVVTGPTMERLRAGLTTETAESRTIAGRTITYLNGGNVAFRREALDELDGFDEYLEIGGSRDLAHRLAAHEFTVTWDDRMAVESEFQTDGEQPDRDWAWKYRSLAYRLCKNYGLRPSILYRLTRHAGVDSVEAMGDVAGGRARPSQWFATGRDVLTNLAIGIKDGLWARRLDRTPRRNPYGRSARTDRAVSVYTWA